MPVPRLTLDDHEVLKLNTVLCLFGSYNDTDDDEHAHKVNVEVVPDVSDAVVKPESRDEHHEAPASDRLDMLPLHWRDNAKVDYQNEPGQKRLVQMVLLRTLTNCLLGHDKYHQRHQD